MPVPSSVVADIGQGVQASWVPPTTCEGVDAVRSLLAGATPGPLVDLMRSGTEAAAARLDCPD